MATKRMETRHFAHAGFPGMQHVIAAYDLRGECGYARHKAATRSKAYEPTR
jgi:hypothetical protein